MNWTDVLILVVGIVVVGPAISFAMYRPDIVAGLLMGRHSDGGFVVRRCRYDWQAAAWRPVNRAVRFGVTPDGRPEHFPGNPDWPA